MADKTDSDSDVELPLSRKRKLGAINVSEEDDYKSDDDDEDMDSEGEDEEGESDDEESGDDDDDDAVNDVDLTDDVNSDQCSICLMEFTNQLLGVPDSCAHIFCSVCIQEWAKNINTCPVDRKVFHVITIRETYDGPQVDQVKVEDRTKIEDEYEDPTSCEVCGIGDREDRMLLCDGCDRGFHMECLTPPLDGIPDGEWFCPDCSSSNSVRHDSQSETVVIGGETPSIQLDPELFSSDQPFSCPSASTSRRRSARTVATRRRRRRRTRGKTGTRAQRGRSSSKRGGSSRGASTSKTRGKRKSKRKRRKGKGKRKTRQAKGNTDGKSGSKRGRFDVSPSRYVLPHEMEPSSSFSLFGNDFQLEYLPCVETSAPITAATKSEDQRSSANSNPDVLCSIFDGLNALHHNGLSVDAKGCLKVSQDVQNNANSGSRSGVSSHAACKQEYSLGAANANALTSYNERKPAISPSFINDVGNKTDVQNMTEQRTKPVIKIMSRDFRDIKDKKDNTRYAKETMPDINKKRIKRFDTSAQESPCSDSMKTAYKRGEELSIPQLTRKSKTTDHSHHKHSTYVGRDSKYGETSYTIPDANALSTYKIPRKKSTAAFSVSGQAPKATTPCIETTRESKFEGNTTAPPSGYKDVGPSRPNEDAMILSQTSSPQRPMERGVGDVSKSISSIKRTYQGSVSVNKCDIQKTPRSIASVNRGSASCVGVVDIQKTAEVLVRRVDQKPVSSIVVSEKTNFSSAKFGDDAMRVRNPASKSLNSSSGFTKIIKENSYTSTFPSNFPQTNTNRGIIDMLNRRKSVLSDSDSDNNTDSSSTRNAALKESNASPKQFSAAETRNSHEAALGKYQAKMLPPLSTAATISSRPVAVVRPTTQESSVVAHENSKDDDAARRRLEGIERLCRKQEIEDEVKRALKWFYRCKEITKEQYKYIFKKATVKINQSSFAVQSRSVSTLVRNYVKKIKGNQVDFRAGM